MVERKYRTWPLSPLYRRVLAAVGVSALVIAGVTVSTTDDTVPGMIALPGATADPTGPTGGPGGDAGGANGGQFQPPGMPDAHGGYNGGDMEHTGTQLRIAAYGPHAANVVGLTDQTDLFSTMKAALSLK